MDALCVTSKNVKWCHLIWPTLYMLPILCQISMPWQRGYIYFNFRLQQPPTRCKDVDGIFYTNWVIVYFISNFVAMATAVGRGGICLTAFNSPTPKTPSFVQESRRYLPQKQSYWLFCFFVDKATGVGHGRICLTSFNSPTHMHVRLLLAFSNK